MRRALIPIGLILAALTGLGILSRIRPPDPPAPEIRSTETAAPPAWTEPGAPVHVVLPAPRPAAPPWPPFEGLLWTTGGVPVEGLVVRLETENGLAVTDTRSDGDGRFVFAPPDLGIAGSPARIHVNPASARDTFETQRVRISRERPHDRIFVCRIRRGASIDVEIEIRNAIPSEDGGGRVRVSIQDLEGGVLERTSSPEETSILIPDRAPGAYAITAVQGNRAAALPRQPLDPDRFPLLLVLERATAIVGRIRTPGGGPARAAVVRLTFDAVPNRVLSGPYVYVAANSTKTYQIVTTTTDEEGAFRIEGLLPVRYAMAIRHESGSLRRAVDVTAAGEVLEFPDLVLQPGTGAIQAHLAFPDGLPKGRGAPRVTVIGFRHRVRRHAVVDRVPGDVRIAGLPPDVYGVVLVRARSIAGRRGRLEQFVSGFATVEVTAGGEHRIALEPNP